MHIYISLANLTPIVNLAPGSDSLGRHAFEISRDSCANAPAPSWHLLLFASDPNYQSEKDCLIALMGGGTGGSWCTAKRELGY